MVFSISQIIGMYHGQTSQGINRNLRPLITTNRSTKSCMMKRILSLACSIPSFHGSMFLIMGNYQPFESFLKYTCVHCPAIWRAKTHSILCILFNLLFPISIDQIYMSTWTIFGLLLYWSCKMFPSLSLRHPTDQILFMLPTKPNYPGTNHEDKD